MTEVLFVKSDIISSQVEWFGGFIGGLVEMFFKYKDWFLLFEFTEGRSTCLMTLKIIFHLFVRSFLHIFLARNQPPQILSQKVYLWLPCPRAFKSHGGSRKSGHLGLCYVLDTV